MTKSSESEARCRELLPCPLCGSAAKIWRLTTYWGIECFAAHGWACISLPACYLTEQDAINAWNTRAHHAALKRCVEVLEDGLRIASDDNDEIFGGDLIARETAILKWKANAKQTLAELKEIL